MADGSIHMSSFCLNFCINFSQKMGHLSRVFSENDIKVFMMQQLSAGKKHYDENTFFQALSEVSVLSFFASRGCWCNAIYEPPIGNNGKNPEAKFVGAVLCKTPLQPNQEIKQTISVNIEVKAPRFTENTGKTSGSILPITLLSDNGRLIIPKFCEQHGLVYMSPRINKLKDFLNSAASKFSIPGEHEFNLLYINWSYCDFPVNGFLEAWGLLTNEINGVLKYPDVAARVGIVPEVFEKITAVIVYTESLEGLMFSDFRFVWQRNGAGPRFRMWVIDPKLRRDELSDQSDILFRITGMNPGIEEKGLFLSDYRLETHPESPEAIDTNAEIYTLIKQNIFHL